MFEPKSEKVSGGSRKFRNEELNYFYSSPNPVGMIKSEILWGRQ